MSPSAKPASTNNSVRFLMSFFFYWYADHRDLHSFPTRRSSDLVEARSASRARSRDSPASSRPTGASRATGRSEEHTSELQSQSNLVCRLLLEKKKITILPHYEHRQATRVAA